MSVSCIQVNLNWLPIGIHIMELSRESIWTGSQWKATTFKSKGPLVIRYITHKVNAWGINHCTHKLIWMCDELFLTGDKKFKVATKLDEKLKLTCTVLQQIVNIQHQNVCADLAKGHEDANGLHYDETNKVCSIQHCNKNSISVTGVPSARISIMFEDKFYPRSECTCFFFTLNERQMDVKNYSPFSHH